MKWRGAPKGAVVVPRTLVLRSSGACCAGGSTPAAWADARSSSRRAADALDLDGATVTPTASAHIEDHNNRALLTAFSPILLLAVISAVTQRRKLYQWS